MINFIAGMIIGGCVGAITASAFVAGKRGEEKEN